MAYILCDVKFYIFLCKVSGAYMGMLHNGQKTPSLKDNIGKDSKTPFDN